MMIDSYNKIALIKLTERYLAKTVLQNDLIAFLEEKIPSIRSVSKEVASLAGKDVNSIYKNKNELQLYNAIGLMRYWNAAIQLCKRHNIPKDNWPNFEEILNKYHSTLDFISIITAEDDMDSLISSNYYEVLKIINFYQKYTPQSDSEITVLNQLKENEYVKSRIDSQQHARKLAQLERMVKK